MGYEHLEESMVRELLDAGLVTAEVKKDHETLYAIVPKGCSLETHDLAKAKQKLADDVQVRATGRPLRHTGNFFVTDVDSFVVMVKRELVPETTIVTSHLENKNFNAIINFSEDGKKAGHGDRKIILELKQTSEFKRWFEYNRQRLSQTQLADFLEENLESIVDPPAGEIIQMISDLKVKKNAQYHSVIDTETGAQSLSYSEEKRGETQNGSLDFRGKFKIALVPFIGSQPYEIDCHLRFSIDSHVLSIFFSMINITKVLEHAFDLENEKVKEAMEELKVEVVNIR